MAARDNVLFHASIANSTAAGTVIPLSVLHGVANVRQGYGTPKLKGIRAMYSGGYTSGGNALVSIPVEIQNSNWLEPAGLAAIGLADVSALADNSLGFLPGRDKELIPNTSWTVTAKITDATTAAGDIYVLFEIEYSDVPGVDAEKLAGSPVIKKCAGTVTASANTLANLGTFDNLLQGKTYVLAEASTQMIGASYAQQVIFVILDSFSNQRGLVRILPTREMGICEQIKGSVYLNKQTYNVGLISSTALSSAALELHMEMVVNSN